MSWFSDLTSKFNPDDFTNEFNKKFNEVTEQAKNALHVNPEMIERLTLTTPELSAERQRMEEEEKRKEHIKDSLAGMFPWETRDPERDILVEECKDAIMKLSSDEASFKGPFLMPDMAVKLEEDKEGEGDDDEQQESDEEDEAAKMKKEGMMPSKESLEKLSKLEPLPKLLQHFDLDAHVGLIQKLLAVDPMLVKMQSKLSGGGEREHYFWKNYFVNCAFARYEAGLDIDEIWSEQLASPKDHQSTEAGEADEGADEEEVITFDHNDMVDTPDEMAFPTPDADQGVAESQASGTDDAKKTATAESDAGDDDFAVLGEDSVDDDFFGGELDELEAEIARELED